MPSEKYVETEYGRLERLDKWIERHIWLVLGGSTVVATGLIVLNQFV